MLRLPQLGSVIATSDPQEPVRLVDASGAANECITDFMRHLVACDYSSETCRSYAYSLLRWLRFLTAVEVAWQRAARIEVRDFVLWMKIAENPQRRRSKGSPPPGAVNPRTGKPDLGPGYAPATINHALSAMRVFYDYHLITGLGPLVNPVPAQRGQDGARPLSHRSPMEVPQRLPRAAYRQRMPQRPPRALSDSVFADFFAALGCSRDRAIIALGVGSGPRASELLRLRLEDLDIGRQVVALEGKGHHDRDWVPVSPDALLWLACYLAETDQRRPPGDTRLWWTRRRPTRPLTYTALRQVVARANELLGTNVTFHDLRHTYAMRMMNDPKLLITDVQRLMRHRSITSTQIYARAQIDDLVAKMQEHYAQPRPAPARPATGYDPAAMAVLFPDLA